MFMPGKVSSLCQFVFRGGGSRHRDIIQYSILLKRSGSRGGAFELRRPQRVAADAVVEEEGL